MQNITMILQRARIMVREMLGFEFGTSVGFESGFSFIINFALLLRVLQTALPLHAASLLARVLAFFSEYNLKNQKQFITLNYWPCFFTGWSQVEYRTDPTSVAELSQLRSAPGISSSGDECDSISWLKNCNFFFSFDAFWRSIQKHVSRNLQMC